jgi:hypothetical protein
MRRKKLTYGVTFFTTAEMYAEMIKVTDALNLGISGFIQGLGEDYFRENFPDSPSATISGTQRKNQQKHPGKYEDSDLEGKDHPPNHSDRKEDWRTNF